MIIKTITFNEIYDVWHTKLWPNRTSPIRSMSSIKYLGGYDINIYYQYNPTFWGIYDNDQLIGVNSGFMTEPLYYRSRGLYVDENYRGKGLSRLLFEELEKQARLEGAKYLWSMPRRGSEYAYFGYGFEQTSEWFDEGVEFGPNCYVRKELK